MLSRYLGSALTRSKLSIDMVVQSAPRMANENVATLRTARTGWKPHRSRRETTGANKKLIRIARTIGSKNSLAHANAQRISTRYAKATSLVNSNVFFGSTVSGIYLRGIWTLPIPPQLNSPRVTLPDPSFTKLSVSVVSFQ